MSALATAPALPLHTAGPYVAAAYVVFVALILLYVAIMAVRLTRTQRDVTRLREELEARAAAGGSGDPGEGEKRDLDRVGAAR